MTKITKTKLCLSILLSLMITLSLTSQTKAAGGVQIDGYFDDWENIPKTEITYMSNNQKCINNAALVRDGEYLYLYVEMHELYPAHIPIDSYYITINGQRLQFFLRYPTADGKGIDWGKNVNLQKNGIVTGLSPFTYYPTYSWGNAAVCVSSGKPNDRMEVAMKISDIEELMGLHEGIIDSGAKVSISMPNVGAESVSLVGTSTGAWISVGLLLMIGISSVYAKKRKGNTL